MILRTILRLYGTDAEAIQREQEAPAADTPERRRTFERVARLERDLAEEG